MKKVGQCEIWREWRAKGGFIHNWCSINQNKHLGKVRYYLMKLNMYTPSQWIDQFPYPSNEWDSAYQCSLSRLNKITVYKAFSKLAYVKHSKMREVAIIILSPGLKFLFSSLRNAGCWDPGEVITWCAFSPQSIAVPHDPETTLKRYSQCFTHRSCS